MTSADVDALSNRARIRSGDQRVVGALAASIAVVFAVSAVAQPVVIRWSGERLTVRAVNIPLRSLVEDIAQQTGIVVSGAERLRGSLTVDLGDVYILDALHVLLEDVNYIVTRESGRVNLRIHSMAGRSPPQGPIEIPGLTESVIAQSVIDVEPDHDADARAEIRDELAELERASASTDSDALPSIMGGVQSDYREVRIRALQVLASRPEEPDAIAEIVSAFSDADAEVVLTASDLLASMPGHAVLDALESQLSPETGPELQLVALRSLALRGDPSRIDAVGRVAREGSPKVREFAQRLLEALKQRSAIAAGSAGR